MQTEKPNQPRRSIERYVWIPRRTKIVAAVVCLLLAFLLWLWASAVEAEWGTENGTGENEQDVVEVCDDVVVFFVDVDGDAIKGDLWEA